MKLDCIWDTDKGTNNYPAVQQALLERFEATSLYDLRKQVFEEHQNSSGYAKNTHTGKLKKGVALSELELAMICDAGYSFFGGTSSLNGDGTFTVVIWTD